MTVARIWKMVDVEVDSMMWIQTAFSRPSLEAVVWGVWVVWEVIMEWEATASSSLETQVRVSVSSLAKSSQIQTLAELRTNAISYHFTKLASSLHAMCYTHFL